MIHRTRMPSLEQTYELFDDPRYLESKGPDHEAYSAMANRLQNFHISPETWPMPEPFELGRPLALRLPVGAGGVNHPQDVADLSDGLLSLGGLGLSGWLERTQVPSSKLNAAIAGFQRLNSLNPGGPTVKVLNGYLPIPQVSSIGDGAPMYEAAALNPESQPPLGRPITAPGMGDEALARSRAEEARADAAFEAERRAEDPFGDIFGGGRRSERNHIDDMLDSFEAEARAQREAEALDGLDRDYAVAELSHRAPQEPLSPMGVPGAVFRKAISDAERSHLEQVGGGYGLYQLTEISLRDIGLWDENNEWSGQWRIWTAEDFLTSLELQDRALNLYMENNDRYLRKAGSFNAFDYRSQRINGLEGNLQITPVGLMAAAHRRGWGKVLAYLEHQEKNNWESDFDGLDGDLPKIFK